MNMTSQRRTVRLQRAAGFSLIEMLAVIVLIGIVAGIVVQAVGKNVDKGKWGSGKAAVARLAGEVESYSLDNGGPPARLEDLIAKPGNASNWQGPYGKDHQAGGDGVNADWGNWQ